MMHRLVFAVAAASLAAGVQAKIVSKTVRYHEGGTVMEGFIAFDDAKGKRPCVLIAHDWDGLGAYEKGRAEQLAKLGYTALAMDLYGRGVRPKTIQECEAEATKFYKDRMLARRRAMAGMKFALGQPHVDRGRIAVMGYCFGGMVSLEMGRVGAPLKGIVTFHGSLNSANPNDARFFKAPVLVLHGAADPFVPKAEVAAFEKEMKAAKKPYRFVSYPGVVHAFTVKGVDKLKLKGAAYDASADKKSWGEMSAFFRKVLK